MRNPQLLNTVDDLYSDNGTTIVDVNSVVFERDLYDLMNEKDLVKYFKDLEYTVRKSFEYRQFIRYLKNDEGMDECSFLENVSSRDNTKVKIEIHHEPFTLYDICLAVFKKRQMNRESLDVESVAEEVMFLHYIGWVGLIPLSITVHELVHNQYLFIPLDKVRGDYNSFTKSYYNYIDPETLDCLDVAEQATKEYNNKQMEMFNRHDIYVNLDGSYTLPRRSEIQALIKGRISVLKEGMAEMMKPVKKPI